MTLQPVTPSALGDAVAPVIRPASARDLEAVDQLLSAADLPREGVAEALPAFVVAEHQGQLVGVAGLEVCCDNALLRSVAIAPGWRGRGVGRALVGRVIAEAESRGIRALYLLTTTAEHYFPSFGFTRTTRDAVPGDVRATAEFRSTCPESATVMRMDLRAVPHPATAAARTATPTREGR